MNLQEIGNSYDPLPTPPLARAWCFCKDKAWRYHPSSVTFASFPLIGLLGPDPSPRCGVGGNHCRRVRAMNGDAMPQWDRNDGIATLKSRLTRQD